MVGSKMVLVFSSPMVLDPGLLVLSINVIGWVRVVERGEVVRGELGLISSGIGGWSTLLINVIGCWRRGLVVGGFND